MSLRRLFAALLALAGVSFALLRVIDAHLHTPAAPLGIVSLELCGLASDACARLLGEWGAAERQWALLSVGVDALFIVVYPALIAVALVLLARRLDGWIARAARLAVVAVVLAGIADVVENFNLTRLLIDTAPGSALAAALAASLKFALLALVLGVLALAATARLIAAARA